MMNSRKILVTHSGQFHADDIFATAVIMLAHADSEIVIKRTRDNREFLEADYLLDVGGEYKPDLGKFDHHQIGGAGVRENGIPYATFGLVWKKYGLELCNKNEVVYQYIDTKLVQPIDAVDNGISIETSIINNVHSYTINDFFGSYQGLANFNYDSAFTEIVEVAKGILSREIKLRLQRVEYDAKVLNLYDNSEDKRIIISPEYYPWNVLYEKSEPIYVVYPEYDSERWAVKAFPIAQHSFESRKPFPDSWAGKTGIDLESVSGVNGALFCHTKKFIVVAKNREAAISLAQKALDA